jgi:hypothetical protein
MASMIPMDELSQQAAVLTTSGLSDAMDRLGIPGHVAGVRATGTARSLCGPAYTVRYRPVQAIGETVGDFIDDVPAGSVVVIDNQGRTDCTVWGGILTEAAHLRDLAGTVIDGICRDAQACDDVGYPLFARANWMRTGKDRVAIDAAASASHRAISWSVTGTASSFSQAAGSPRSSSWPGESRQLSSESAWQFARGSAWTQRAARSVTTSCSAG